MNTGEEHNHLGTVPMVQGSGESRENFATFPREFCSVHCNFRDLPLNTVGLQNSTLQSFVMDTAISRPPDHPSYKVVMPDQVTREAETKVALGYRRNVLGYLLTIRRVW
jgi:hypothetical protein